MTTMSENHGQSGKRFEEFFDKIKDIFEKGLEEKGIEGRYKTVPIEFSGFHIDLPRKKGDMYHGSSYEILCNKPKTRCKIKGDLVTEEEYDYDVTKTFEESDCKIFSVHTHKREETFPKREYHLHFICQDRDREDTIKMINFLKKY